MFLDGACTEDVSGVTDGNFPKSEGEGKSPSCSLAQGKEESAVCSAAGNQSSGVDLQLQQSVPTAGAEGRLLCRCNLRADLFLPFAFMALWSLLS